MSEEALPTSRPTLLQEVRIRWVQTQTKAEGLYAHVKELVMSGVETTEEKLGMILDMLTGYTEHTTQRTAAKYGRAKAKAGEKYDDVSAAAGEKYDEASKAAGETAEAAQEYVGEKYADAKGKADKKKGEYETAGKKYWNEKVEQAQRKAEEAKVEL